MRIGIISDTHGKSDRTQQAVRLLESLEVDAVLHCGDIGTAEVVRHFHPWPTHFVFGNCDHDHQSLREAIEAEGQTCHGEFGDLTMEGVRIALLHSHDYRRFQNAIGSGDYGLVCYGHTHVADVNRQNGVVVLNPGAVYRASPPSFAIVDLPSLQTEIIPL